MNTVQFTTKHAEVLELNSQRYLSMEQGVIEMRAIMSLLHGHVQSLEPEMSDHDQDVLLFLTKHAHQTAKDLFERFMTETPKPRS